MKLKSTAIALAALVMLSVPSAIAARSVGYNFAVAPPQTDVRLSLPFNTEEIGTFTVDSVASFGVRVLDTLVEDAFSGTHYVRFITGEGEGLWTTITDNGTDDFVFEDTDVLDYVNPGDAFRVYKHHTLRSVYPLGMYGLTYTNGTQILIYENDLDNMVRNRSASKVAAYTTSGGGRWLGAGVTNDTILKPETQFILRNNSTQALAILSRGIVPDYAVSRLIAANGDLVIGTGYPVPVTLTGSGLESSLRQVLLYNNSAPGINKSASLVATYSPAGQWIGAGVTGQEPLKPSESFTLRLPASEAGMKVTINKPY